MPMIAWVALGGACGAVARFGAGLLVANLLRGGTLPAGPLATLLVNVLGSFALGVLLGREGLDPRLRAGLGTGVLGAFTTFSTFSVETVTLLERGAPGLAAGLALANVGLSVVAAAAGLALARAFTPAG